MNTRHEDPVLALNRSTRAWAIAAGALALGVGVWAFWPIDRAPLSLESASGAEHAPPPKLALNADAFAAPLWTPTPPAPAPVVVQKPVTPPLKLQLIGITRDTPPQGGSPVLRAALYDPDSDKLLIVAAGEKIKLIGTATSPSSPTYTVASLTADAIELTDGETTRTLSLKDDRPPSP